VDRRLTLEEYELSKHLAARDYPFYALMAVLMRDADTYNLGILRTYWPKVWESLRERRNAPLGVVERWDGFTAKEYYGKLRAQVSEAEEESVEEG
jgi:hypothetical protein